MEQRKRDRSEFFKRLRALAESANLPAEEAEELAAEAVRAIRAAQPAESGNQPPAAYLL